MGGWGGGGGVDGTTPPIKVLIINALRNYFALCKIIPSLTPHDFVIFCLRCHVTSHDRFPPSPKTNVPKFQFDRPGI